MEATRYTPDPRSSSRDGEAKVHPFTLAAVYGALQSTQREMTNTMERTGRSSVFTIARDYSNCIFDWDARMIMQGEDIPAHLGARHLATKAVARYFEGDVHPGDVMYHNDPGYDGGHLCDMGMYKPIFFEGALAFWAVSIGHVIDAGGPVPGTYNMNAKEIYAEGLRIPPLKIVERGVPREDVINLILTNVRARRNQRGDMNAQLGAVRVAERRLIALLEKFGALTICACVDQLHDLAEEHVRSIIRRLPDGVYEGSASSQDTGHGRGDQIIKAIVTISEDEASIRLDAPPQLEYYINAYRSNALSGVYAGFQTFVQVEPPFNEGLYRPVTVDFGPPGTMVNATEPAPHMQSGPAHETICDAVREALNQADPSSASAGWNLTWGVNLAGKRPRTDEPWVEMLMSAIIGGGGAVNGASDGWHAVGATASMGALQTGDSELVELLAPIIVHRLSLAEDSAGPGRWRGGCGLITEIEPIGHRMTVIAWGHGSKEAVRGVAGAHATLVDEKLARGWHLRDGEVLQEVRSNMIFTIAPGERYITRSQGGGGAGDPFQRPAEEVRDDVLNRKVSRRGARFDYGVVLNGGALDIDWTKTRAARTKRAVIPSDVEG